LRRKNFGIWSAAFPQASAPKGRQVELSTTTQLVYDYLMKHGASFFTDLVEGTRLLRAQVEESLAELVAYGIVVSDSFAGLRALLTPGSRKTQAAARRKQRHPVYDMASAGRWSILQGKAGIGEISPDRESRLGSPAERSPAKRASNGWSMDVDPEVAEQVARILLSRYGVVFKRLLEREEIALPWRMLLRTYHRLEARGEIRGGRFVAGISGEQFALPEAVGMLRSIRRQGTQQTLISVCAADPLNLAGIITSGSRLTAHTSNRILYQDGVPVAALESGRTDFLVEMSRAMEWKAKAALMRKATPPQLRSYLRRPA
jgi:ATP-dependent Lhr-like helicase